MDILLTGASGFAGAHMLQYLIENTSSRIYCPVTYTHGGHKERIPALVEKTDLERVIIFEHDLATHPIENTGYFEGIDLIINFASESHVDRSIANPTEFAINNINLMINLLEYARSRGSSCSFLHISTDEVYGALPKGEQNLEWIRPNLPSNPYSASKAAQEAFAIAYFKTYKIPMAIINSTNMIGETQNQEKFLPKAINRILHDEEIQVDTDPKGKMGSRKYVYVQDVASAVWLVAQKLQSEIDEIVELDLPFKFHIAGIDEITNLQLIEILAARLQKEARIKIAESPRPGYDLRYELSVEKISTLGWKEKETIRKRIKEIVDWTIQHPEWLHIDHAAND